jgi:surface carbohydrate biosynthesis protein (TIGR04326 family)
VKRIVIWDKDAPPLESNAVTILWRNFSKGNHAEVVSIPELIEARAEEYRAQYLAWVFDLGEMPILGRSLIENLRLRDGFTYWWMTLIAEKSNFSKSPQINDAVRLIAFKDWLEGRALTDVELVSPNIALAKCIKLWCDKKGIAFRWRYIQGSHAKVTFARSFYNLAPHILKGLIWAIYRIREAWPLRGVGLQRWKSAQGGVTFFSYLFNLHFEKANVGIFDSQYWGLLPDALLQEGVETNWLHLYTKNKKFSSSMAADMLNKLNRHGEGKQVHVSLETFLSISVIYRATLDWIRLIYLGVRLERSIISGLSRGDSFNLWPFFSNDWKDSINGPTAYGNLLNFHLFEAAIKFLPKQQVGVFLQENQGWEFGLIQIWKKRRKDLLIGCPHSSVRFWDLRYFYDSRSYNKSVHNHLPMPDKVALNGGAATRAYIDSGYPSADIVQVEALRYLHLEDAKEKAVTHKDIANPLRLLVLGDYLSNNTQKQMELLGVAIKEFSGNLSLIVKPHPACPIAQEDYPHIPMAITMEPMTELLKGCDVAYSSAVTSAAIEVYCVGTPVISVLDPNMLNLSPLRGYEGIFFVSTPEELVRALNSVMCQPTMGGKKDYFTVDKRLSRWHKILKNTS